MWKSREGRHGDVCWQIHTLSFRFSNSSKLIKFLTLLVCFDFCNLLILMSIDLLVKFLYVPWLNFLHHVWLIHPCWVGCRLSSCQLVIHLFCPFPWNLLFSQCTPISLSVVLFASSQKISAAVVLRMEIKSFYMYLQIDILRQTENLY